MIKSIIHISFYLLILYYLSFHILNGRYGIYSYITLNNQLKSKNSSLALLNNEHKMKKSKINSLKKNNLDMDLFEQELKEKLNFSHKNELIIKLK